MEEELHEISIPGVEAAYKLIAAIDDARFDYLKPPTCLRTIVNQIVDVALSASVTTLRSQIAPLADELRNMAWQWYQSLKLPVADAMYSIAGDMFFSCVEKHFHERQSFRWTKCYCASRAAIAWINQKCALNLYQMYCRQPGFISESAYIIRLGDYQRRNCALRSKCQELNAPDWWQFLANRAMSVTAMLVDQASNDYQLAAA